MTQRETYEVECELTDTFGGEANYSWAKRETIELPVGLSDKAFTRRVKAALMLTGVRGKLYNNGDQWEFRPYRRCVVAFANVVY
jgi:hypothetical protein